MRDFLAGIGAFYLCCLAVVGWLVALSLLWERRDRKVREREQLEKETVQHLARVTGALRIINLAEYRERKANASAAGVTSHEHEASLPVVPTGGGVQSIASSHEAINA